MIMVMFSKDSMKSRIAPEILFLCQEVKLLEKVEVKQPEQQK